MRRVARCVSFQLRNPIVVVGLGKARGFTGGVGVLVPETAVNKYHHPATRKHEAVARDTCAWSALELRYTLWTLGQQRATM